MLKFPTLADSRRSFMRARKFGILLSWGLAASVLLELGVRFAPANFGWVTALTTIDGSDRSLGVVGALFLGVLGLNVLFALVRRWWEVGDWEDGDSDGVLRR